jgi:putative acetyltransferase
MEICQATTPDQVAAVRGLFQEYAAWLGIDLSFQGFNDELVALPGSYAPPGGRLFIAMNAGEPAGCVAVRPAGGSACEMKRLFIWPAYRGQGLGRRLASLAISETRNAGYSKMLLDTLPSMMDAIHLYQSLGFVARGAYYETPLKETVFMELRL